MTIHTLLAALWLAALLFAAGIWRTRADPRARLAALILAAQLPAAQWGASLPREPPATTPDVAHATPDVAPRPIDHTTPEDHRDTPPAPAPDSTLPDRLDWYRRRTDALAR